MQKKWVDRAEEMVSRRFVERFEAFGIPFTLDIVKESGALGEQRSGCSCSCPTGEQRLTRVHIG